MIDENKAQNCGWCWETVGVADNSCFCLPLRDDDELSVVPITMIEWKWRWCYNDFGGGRIGWMSEVEDNAKKIWCRHIIIKFMHFFNLMSKNELVYSRKVLP